MPVYTIEGQCPSGMQPRPPFYQGSEEVIPADDRGCHWQGGYSDRFVWVIRDANQATDYYTNSGQVRYCPSLSIRPTPANEDGLGYKRGAVTGPSSFARQGKY